jgi:DNA polymerase-3 subunit delta
MATHAQHPPLTAAIIGQVRLLRSEALARLLESFGEGVDPLGPTQVDGPTAVLAEVLDEVRTVSLLGHRVVIVDDADSFISDNRAKLEKYCANPSDTGTLILLCNSFPRTQNLHKIIAKNGTIVACDPPRGRAVIGWICDRAEKEHGKRMRSQAATTLREQLGDDLGRLDSELSKLAAFTGDRPEITADDIQFLTGQHREENVFAVIDAIHSGRTADALRHWEQVLLTDRAAPGRAVAGLAWGVRRLLEARRDLDRGVGLHELAKRLFTDPATARRRLERLAVPQLVDQQRDLLAADIAIKTSAGTLEVAVEKFIVKHSATKHAARAVPA